MTTRPIRDRMLDLAIWAYAIGLVALAAWRLA